LHVGHVIRREVNLVGKNVSSSQAAQQTIDAQIRAVLEPHRRIHLAVLFGSLAVDRARPHSDVDLAVAADRALTASEKMTLIEQLAEHIGRPVDLIDLNTAGEPLLGQIIRHGRRVLGTDSAYAGFIRKHVFEQADFMPYRTRILEARRRAWIGK